MRDIERKIIRLERRAAPTLSKMSEAELNELLYRSGTAVKAELQRAGRRVPAWLERDIAASAVAPRQPVARPIVVSDDHEYRRMNDDQLLAACKRMSDEIAGLHNVFQKSPASEE